jgi:hypothetical protein
MRRHITEEADAEQKGYDRGFMDGLRAYAINKDGKQYVGSCGTPLQKAIDKRKECWSYTPF